jgi:hypothetical protein
LDGGDELGDIVRAGIEGDARFLRREVDGRLDAVETVQASLDPRRARRARHALDFQPHACGRLLSGRRHQLAS